MKVFYMVFFRNLGANRIIFLKNALHIQSEFGDFIAVVCEHFLHHYKWLVSRGWTQHLSDLENVRDIKLYWVYNFMLL